MHDLQTFFDDHQLHHSNLQIDAFITMRSGGTAYGCYKQATHELYDRWRGLIGMYGELAKLDLEIEEKTEMIECIGSRMSKLDLTVKLLRREEILKNIGDTEREFTRFQQQCEALKPLVGDLTPERRDQLDQDMWVHNLKYQCAMDLYQHGKISAGVLGILLSLPREIRKRVDDEIFNHQELMRWLQGRPHFELPELPWVPFDERSLLEFQNHPGLRAARRAVQAGPVRPVRQEQRRSGLDVPMPCTHGVHPAQAALEDQVMLGMP